MKYSYLNVGIIKVVLIFILGFFNLGAQPTATQIYGGDPEFRLILAAQKGNAADVSTFIYEQKVDVNTQMDNGLTALIAAAQWGYLDVVRLLIEAKANINLHKNGYTALYASVSQKHPEVAKQLLLAKADPNIKMGSIGGTPLMMAASKGDLASTDAIIEAQADVNARTLNGQTALHMAVTAEIAEALINAKALVDSKSNVGYTPLSNAAGKGNLNLVRVLIKSGANVNHKNLSGNTPLMAAASEGHLEVVKFLISQNADVYQKNNDGKTARMCVDSEQFQAVADVLDAAQSKIK